MTRRQSDIGFHEDVAFHSQQAAEKYLKGLGFDAAPPGLVAAAKDLDRHYLGARYPDGGLTYTPAVDEAAPARIT